MEKVDILLATYNGENYIKEQLDSILNQTYTDFRLLISDDMSTDGTYKILKDYEKKDERITVFKQEKNLGVVSNFEFLLSKVQNKYYAFSDQDDIWNNDKLEKTISKLEKENADLVFTDLEVVDNNKNTIYKSYWELKEFKDKILKYNSFEALYLNNYVTGCTIVAKADTIKKCLPLPKTSKFVLHDYWMALIISQSGKIVFLEEPTIKYRQHKNNKVGSKKKSETMNFKDIRKMFIEVKKEHFKVFIENENKFNNEEIKELNKKALSYYEKLEKTKIMNFSNWNLFFKLYKYENKKYILENFLILNVPIIAGPLISLRSILKGMKK